MMFIVNCINFVKCLYGVELGFFYSICYSSVIMLVIGKDFLNLLVWFFNNMEFLIIGIFYLKKKWIYF